MWNDSILNGAIVRYMLFSLQLQDSFPPSGPLVFAPHFASQELRQTQAAVHMEPSDIPDKCVQLASRLRTWLHALPRRSRSGSSDRFIIRLAE